MSDRLQEIRARLDEFDPDKSWVEVSHMPLSGVKTNHVKWQSLLYNAPADIAWLLDEVERLRLLVPCENCGEQSDSDECAYCGATAGAA